MVTIKQTVSDSYGNNNNSNNINYYNNNDNINTILHDHDVERDDVRQRTQQNTAIKQIFAYNMVILKLILK